MNRNNIPNPFMGTYNYPFQPNQYYQGPYQQVQNTYRSGNICPGIPFLPPQQSISSIPNQNQSNVQLSSDVKEDQLTEDYSDSLTSTDSIISIDGANCSAEKASLIHLIDTTFQKLNNTKYKNKFASHKPARRPAKEKRESQSVSSSVKPAKEEKKVPSVSSPIKSTKEEKKIPSVSSSPIKPIKEEKKSPSVSSPIKRPASEEQKPPSISTPIKRPIETPSNPSTDPNDQVQLQPKKSISDVISLLSSDSCNSFPLPPQSSISISTSQVPPNIHTNNPISIDSLPHPSISPSHHRSSIQSCTNSYITCTSDSDSFESFDINFTPLRNSLDSAPSSATTISIIHQENSSPSPPLEDPPHLTTSTNPSPPPEDPPHLITSTNPSPQPTEEDLTLQFTSSIPYSFLPSSLLSLYQFPHSYLIEDPLFYSYYQFFEDTHLFQYKGETKNSFQRLFLCCKHLEPFSISNVQYMLYNQPLLLSQYIESSITTRALELIY